MLLRSTYGTGADLRIDPAQRDPRLIAMTLMDRTDHAAAIWTPAEAREIAAQLIQLANEIEVVKP